MLLELPPPTAVLYDIGGYAGRVAAHRWGVPAIQLSPTYVAWEGYEEDMAEFTTALKASESGARYFAAMRAWLDEHGIEIDADDFLGRPEACVVLIPRVLQPNRSGWGSATCSPARASTRRRTQGWTPPRGDDRPLVYVSMGTAYTDVPDLYERVVTELRDDFRLVISTGKVDPASLGAGIEAARTQPQLDVLAHADVFITHAGMGSAAESLWFGVPTVAVPQAVDQFANAAQLEAIGAGVQLGELERAGSRRTGANVCSARPRAARRGARATAARRAPPTPSSGSAERGPEVALGVGEEAAGEAHDVEVVVLGVAEAVLVELVDAGARAGEQDRRVGGDDELGAALRRARRSRPARRARR